MVRVNQKNLYLLVISLLLFFALLLSIAIGSTDIPFNSVIRILGAKLFPWIETDSLSEGHKIIIESLRTPRTLIAALVGAALAIAGVQMQGLFRNPLASPDIISTSSGGAFGAVIALATGLATRSAFYLPLLAFSGAFISLWAVYSLARWQNPLSTTTLLLAGIAVNALITAMISFIIMTAWSEYEVAREIVFWTMGGLENSTWLQVIIALPGILLGSLIAFWYARELDMLLMGTETALVLGVDVEHTQRMILVSTALLTGTAVAVSGIIGFVGLIIPHSVRFLIGPTHRYLMTASALTGAVFLIFIDLLARTVYAPQEIRLGILTALVGTPIFLYLLLQQR